MRWTIIDQDAGLEAYEIIGEKGGNGYEWIVIGKRSIEEIRNKRF